MRFFSFFSTSYTVQDDDLPESFDWREEKPECFENRIRNQGSCGSCWAHAVSEVISDRVCIATEGESKPVFSPQQLVDCDLLDHGCHGGTMITP